MNAGVLVLLALRAQAAAPDLLAKEPAPGSVVWREDVPALRLASATLSNGVRLHAITAGGAEAHARLVLPGGELRETDANRGISAAAAVALAQPGSARVSPAAVRAYLAGKTIAVAGQAEPDALVLRLRTAPADLEPALRLAHLVLTEGRLDPERFRQWQTEAITRARADHDDPARRLEQATTAALMKDDPRLPPPSAEQITRLAAPAVTAWLDAHLREAPLEVTLVAGLPLDDLVALGLKYFGSLPRRRLRDSGLASLQPAPRAGPVDEQIQVPGARQAHLRVAWRLPLDLDARGARALGLAARVLQRRLIADLHDKRHLITSPDDLATAVVVSPARRAERWMGVTVRSDPARATELAAAARAAAEQLARSGPSAAEMAAARKQLEPETAAAYASSRAWADRLEGFDSRAQAPDDLARAAHEASRSGRQELLDAPRDLLRRCLTDEGRLQIVVAGTH